MVNGPDLSRRSLLQGAGAVGLAAGLSGANVAGATQTDTTMFRWGVASFDPTADSVLLWTRAIDEGEGPVPLRWILASDPELGDVVASGEVTATSETDHCVTVEVAGLQAHRHWWYAFEAAAGPRSIIGRTRTMPATAEPVRLGALSCSRFASNHFGVCRALSTRELDLVVHLGDYIYEDGDSGARDHDPPERLITLGQYRRRYSQHRLDPDLQALHARHPMVAVWDDHEVAGNAWRDGAESHDPAFDGPWIDRLLAAGRARHEWLPGRITHSEVDGRPRLWRTVPLGGLAELVVLDTRHWGRERQPRTADELSGTPLGPRSMLGADQMDFVRSRLHPEPPHERRPWVVIANQVMFHPMTVPVPDRRVEETAAALGTLIVDGRALNPDQWDGYPEARAELSQAIGGRGGVVMLTGDIHSGWGWEGPANDGGRPAMVELVTPSVSTGPMSAVLPGPAVAIEAALQALNPELSYVEVSRHGYLLVHLDPEGMQAEWWLVRPDRPTSEELGAARTAPRSVPMHLSEAPTPLDEPASTEPPPGDGPGSPVPVIDGDDDLGRVLGGAAAAGLAAIALAVTLRRRRGR